MGLLSWSLPSFNLSSSLDSPFSILHLKSWGLTYPPLPHTSGECVLSGPSNGKTERTQVMRIHHIPWDHSSSDHRVWFPFLRIWAVCGFPTAAVVAVVETRRLGAGWCTTKCRKEKWSISWPFADHQETPCSLWARSREFLLELYLHKRPIVGFEQP